jgi:hypothetical protein
MRLVSSKRQLNSNNPPLYILCERDKTVRFGGAPMKATAYAWTHVDYLLIEDAGSTGETQGSTQMSGSLILCSEIHNSSA